MALVDQIIGVESGGDPNAKNPLSSASGPGQFLDSTWLATVAKHRPDIAEGRSPQELLSLKTDPSLAREMTAALASDNAGILSGAGAPVTPGTTYLAHFAGPQGALGILNADPSTPAGAILGQRVVDANPFLRGMTAAGLKAWADKKMGGRGESVASAAPAPLSFGAPAPSIRAASGISEIPADTAIASAFPAIFQQEEQQAPTPPPLFLPPRLRLDLNSIQPKAPASSRGFAFRGRR